MGVFKELDIELQQIKQQPEPEMEDPNKQEEILGYELDEQMDVLLRKVEKHVFNPHYLEDRDKRDLENLVSLVRQELMNGAITQSTLDKRKWLTPDEVAVKVTEAFEAGVRKGMQQGVTAVNDYLRES